MILTIQCFQKKINFTITSTRLTRDILIQIPSSILRIYTTDKKTSLLVYSNFKCKNFQQLTVQKEFSTDLQST